MRHHNGLLCFLFLAMLTASPILAQSSFKVTTTNNSGPGSLRAAILNANTRSNSRIVFDIPRNQCDGQTGVCSIEVTSNLPEVSKRIEIDGLTQPGADCSTQPPTLQIELSGRKVLNEPGVALIIKANASTVRGLVINDFRGEPGTNTSGTGLTLEGNENRVECNFIGLTPDGMENARGAMNFPLSFEGNDGIVMNNAMVGPNFVSGDRNRIQNNTVGLTADGITNFSEDFPYFGSLSIHGSDNLVGGTAPGEGNVLGGRLSLLGTSEQDSENNQVFGNKVGLNRDGERTLGSGNLSLDEADNNQVGGTEPGTRNYIAGRLSLYEARDNVIQGNYVGVDLTGTRAFDTNGEIELGGASTGNLVGGSTPEARNLVASGIGISLSQGNTVHGNYVGVDYTGMQPLEERDGFTYALTLLRASDNQIGGTGNGEGNILVGTFFHARLTDAFDNRIEGNCIGTDADGQQFLSGDLFGGIRLTDGSARNTIGGNEPAAANIIGSARLGAITLEEGSNENAVLGNYIGTDASGTLPLGSLGPGIVIDSSFQNVIGSAEAPNVIAFHKGDGVQLTNNAAQNTISANSIYANDGLGINLDGGTEDPFAVTANDPDGPNGSGNPDDALPNGLQNFPTLTLATLAGQRATVEGTLSSQPLTTYRVEVFASATCDDSGYGEGERFLKTQQVTTNGNGQAAFMVTLDDVTIGTMLTATATDEEGNTSEFSDCFEIVTGVATEAPTAVPRTYTLAQNYPNPFNPSTQIAFALPQAEAVRLTVYDILGREVAVLMDQQLPAGQHEVMFDAALLPSGMYLYRLAAGSFVETRRMLLMK